jgi:hypothetical protein
MAGSFGRFHLPTTRLWQTPIPLLRAEAAKSGGGKMSMRLLSQQRLDVLDKGTFSALVAARLSALCRTENSKRAVAQDGILGGCQFRQTASGGRCSLPHIG